MAKVLVVEDELPMLQGLKDNLEFEGHAVDTACDGPEALDKIKTQAYDIILLDVMLPSMSGFDICRNIRGEGINTPVLMLTAKGEEIDKVLGLELGADDYLTKPFSLRELLSRIKAILRRAGATTEKVPKNIQIGKLSVDFACMQATSGGKTCKMSHKEFEILKYLLEHENEVIDRYNLLADVWGIKYKTTTRTLDNFIVKLRAKMEEDPANPKIIQTIHGMGYKFILPV